MMDVHVGVTVDGHLWRRDVGVCRRNSVGGSGYFALCVGVGVFLMNTNNNYKY